MFKRDEIKQFLPFELSEEKWQEIEQLKDCNHLMKPQYGSKIGNNYHRLWVIGRGPSRTTPSGQTKGQWWCICSCDKHPILLVNSSNLTSKNTKSCGCWDLEVCSKRIAEVGRKMSKDLTG